MCALCQQLVLFNMQHLHITEVRFEHRRHSCFKVIQGGPRAIASHFHQSTKKCNKGWSPDTQRIHVNRKTAKEVNVKVSVVCSDLLYLVTVLLYMHVLYLKWEADTNLSTTARASVKRAAKTSPMKYSAKRPIAWSSELRSLREQWSRRQSFSAVIFRLRPETKTFHSILRFTAPRLRKG